MDPEILAMKRSWQALVGLDVEARVRALGFVCSKVIGDLPLLERRKWSDALRSWL